MTLQKEEFLLDINKTNKMKTQVKIFGNASNCLEKDLNEFLLTIESDLIKDIKYIGEGGSSASAMVIYEVKIETETK